MHSRSNQHGFSFVSTSTMDDILLLVQNLYIQHQFEEQRVHDLVRLRLLALALLITGSNEDHARAVENRRPRRHYLRHANLLPNPRIGTPWRCLYESNDDHAFLVSMGVNVSVSQRIMGSDFANLWYTLPIGQLDFNPVGPEPKPRHRSLDAEGGLGLVLHWLSLTMRHVSLQQIFALTPSTVS